MGGAPGQVTQILEAVGAGDARAAEQLLPLVYEELRRLAAARMANEPPGQTLQPTALVHEAWLRLAGAKMPFGRAAAISLALPLKPCAAFWSRTPGASAPGATVETR